MTDGVVPISDDERRGRIEKARRLMIEQGIGAIVLEPGTSMVYFTGVKLGAERAAVRGRDSGQGRARVRHSGVRGDAGAGAHQVLERRPRPGRKTRAPTRASPASSGTAAWRAGASAWEERVRFFIVDGVRQELPAGADYVIATPVTAGCRMFKSPAEIALLQKANDITIAAYQAGLPDAA